MEYFRVYVVEITLVLFVQAPPVLLMPFNLHFCIIFAYFSRIRKFREIFLHELGEVLMLPLSLGILMHLQTKHPFLLLYFLLIYRNQVCKFLCVVDLWLRRIDDVFVVVLFVVLGMRQVILFVLSLWVSCFCVKMEWLRLSWMKYLLFLSELLLYPLLFCLVIGDFFDVKLIGLHAILLFGFWGEIILGNLWQLLPRSLIFQTSLAEYLLPS